MLAVPRYNERSLEKMKLLTASLMLPMITINIWCSTLHITVFWLCFHCLCITLKCSNNKLTKAKRDDSDWTCQVVSFTAHYLFFRSLILEIIATKIAYFGCVRRKEEKNRDSNPLDGLLHTKSTILLWWLIFNRFSFFFFLATKSTVL